MCKMWIYLGTERVNWRVYTMEENIFDKFKNVVRKPKPEPTKPKATKISDIKLTDDSKHKTFTLDDEKKK